MARIPKTRRIEHYLCEHLDLTATAEELKTFRTYWKNGLSIYEIAKKMKREPEEIVFFVIDQASLEKIEQRPGGIWGTKPEKEG